MAEDAIHVVFGGGSQRSPFKADIIFDDIGILSRRSSYWTPATPPQIFLLEDDRAMISHSDWMITVLPLVHTPLGGATDGSWTFGLIHSWNDIRFLSMRLNGVRTAPGRLRNAINPMLPGRSRETPDPTSLACDGLFPLTILSPTLALPHHLSKSGWVRWSLNIS